MANVVYVLRDDGLGEDPIDLHRCRRFRVVDGWHLSKSITYYLSLETEDRRWVREVYEEESGCNVYRFAHVNEVAYDMFLHLRRIPDDIERDPDFNREIVCDRSRYRKWLVKPSTRRHEPPARTQPRWDQVERCLYYGNTLCRKYPRKAPKQFALLNAFERAGWPESIRNPLEGTEELKDTVRDLNEGMNGHSPFRLSKDRLRVRWERCVRNNGETPQNL